MGSFQKKIQFFLLVKYWFNLIFCLTYTKPIFKQSLPTYLLTHWKKWDLVENVPHVGFFKLFVLIFKSWCCHANHSVWDAFQHFSSQFYLFVLSGELGLIGHPLVFHGFSVLQRDWISFVQKYLCYLEYFQEGNDLLGCYLVFFDWNIELQKLCLKKCFLVMETYKYWC